LSLIVFGGSAMRFHRWRESGSIQKIWGGCGTPQPDRDAAKAAQLGDVGHGPELW
jgi:hypothetical protein